MDGGDVLLWEASANSSPVLAEPLSVAAVSTGEGAQRSLLARHAPPPAEVEVRPPARILGRSACPAPPPPTLTAGASVHRQQRGC